MLQKPLMLLIGHLLVNKQEKSVSKVLDAIIKHLALSVTAPALTRQDFLAS